MVLSLSKAAFLLPLITAASATESNPSKPRFGAILNWNPFAANPVNPVHSETMSVGTFSLPALKYAYDALEPSISAQIMELHHSKHHQAYVTNLNNALTTYAAALSSNDVPTQIALQAAIKFNGGGHINHSLFWDNLCPASSPDADPRAAEKLVAAITSTWGGLDQFRAAMTKALLGLQGSGWGWLVKDEHGLRITTTKDQDPVVGSEVPILGIDMWEHAYYLQYLNGKAAYVENIWKVVNWKTAEERFVGSREDVFKGLKASI